MKWNEIWLPLWHYIGNVLTKKIINFLGRWMQLFLVISSGQWFHTVLLSFMKLFCVNSEWTSMVNVPFIWDLVILSLMFIVGTLALNQLSFLSLFRAFHTSVIFVCAFILFTDNIPVFAKKDSVLKTFVKTFNGLAHGVNFIKWFGPYAELFTTYVELFMPYTLLLRSFLWRKRITCTGRKTVYEIDPRS